MTTENNQIKLSADYLDTDGTNISRTGSEDDGLENLTLSLSGRYNPTDNIEFDYTLRHTDKTTEFDGVDFFNGEANEQLILVRRSHDFPPGLTARGDSRFDCTSSAAK